MSKARLARLERLAGLAEPAPAYWTARAQRAWT